MFDVDKFIECIHNESALWEKRAKEYSDKTCRHRSWNNVGESMYDNWLELDLGERDDKVKEMKTKWRHIRDNFMKYVNQGMSGDSAHKKKKYIYADSLSFLLHTIEKRKTLRCAAENTEENRDEGEQIKDNVDNEDCALSPTIVNASTSRNQHKLLHTESRERTSSLTLFQSELLRKLDYFAKREEEDADKSFLMSLLSDYKKLNDDEKLDFRLITLHFFRNIRQKQHLQDLTSLASIPQPSIPTETTSVDPHYQYSRQCPSQATIQTMTSKFPSQCPSVQSPQQSSGSTHTPSSVQSPRFIQATSPVQPTAVSNCQLNSMSISTRSIDSSDS